MEKNYYNDNFEQLLRETTDDFRMYPSKRVWHSLYNDLHPARRWPSLAVCLLLISAVLYIGVSNNNSINRNTRGISNENLMASGRTITDSKGQPTRAPSNIQIPSGSGKKSATPYIIASVSQPGPSSTGEVSNEQLNVEADNNNSNNNNINSNNITAINNRQVTASNNQLTSTLIPSEAIIPGSIEVQKIINAESPFTVGIQNKVMEKTENTVAEVKTAELSKPTLVAAKTAAKINTEELAWIEDYAFHNKSFAKKWKTKRSIQYYITPSIGFRELNKNTDYEPASTLVVSNSNSNRNINDVVNQNAAINLEAGTAILFDLTKKIRLKTGLQFNYTNYITNAFELKHPTQTTLLLNDLRNGYPQLAPYNSVYANSGDLSPVKLNNKTIQLSMPIGADIRLAGKDRLKWYAGATVQPTYIAAGNTYLISSDAKNYVSEESMLRNWNINGGIETFVSYKTNSGISIHAGPQFRYQFLSTYSKRYTYTEKLYNVGLKMGITRSF